MNGRYLLYGLLPDIIAHILRLLMLQRNLRSLYFISAMEHLQLKLKEKILIGFVIWLTECLMMTVAMRT